MNKETETVKQKKIPGKVIDDAAATNYAHSLGLHDITVYWVKPYSPWSSGIYLITSRGRTLKEYKNLQQVTSFLDGAAMRELS